MNAIFKIVGRMAGLFLLCLSGTIHAQSPTFYVQDAVALPGQEVIVNIRAVNLDMIVGAQFSVSWDTEALDFVGVENIALEGAYDQNFNITKLDSGRLGYLEFDQALNPLGIADSTVLFSVRYRPTMQSGGTTSIGFSDSPVAIRASDEMNDPVDVETMAGVVDLGTIASVRQFAEDPRFTAAPNPFTVVTTVEVELGYAGAATLELLDLQGRVLQRRPVRLQSGSNRFRVEAGNLPAEGAYLIRLTTEREQLHRKVILGGAGR